MEIDGQQAHLIVQKYIGTNATLTRLGWGISGFVFLSPNLRTAIKIHKRIEG